MVIRMFLLNVKILGYNNYEEGSDIFVIDLISCNMEQLTNFIAGFIVTYFKDWQ